MRMAYGLWWGDHGTKVDHEWLRTVSIVFLAAPEL